MPASWPGTPASRDTRIPGWALADGQAMIPSRQNMRLWQLAEHALEDPDIAMTIASRHPTGRLDLFDYLFATAPISEPGARLSAAHRQVKRSVLHLRAQVFGG
jgi:hypothetical protein